MIDNGAGMNQDNGMSTLTDMIFKANKS